MLIATSNPHKRDEIRAIFDACAAETHRPAGWTLLTLADLPAPIAEPIEDGDTFEANALLKARYYCRAAGMMTLADDSGLEVDALGGEPGVHSARYSGATGPRPAIDLANNRLLLKNLGDLPPEQRTARFVCAMALVTPDDPDRPLAVVRGTVEGRILMPDETSDPQAPERGKGENGFGYDPLLFLPDLDCTSAQLTPEHKNRISHRGHAARQMFAELQRLNIAKEPSE